jgi:hypothetical protein
LQFGGTRKSCPHLEKYSTGGAKSKGAAVALFPVGGHTAAIPDWGEHAVCITPPIDYSIFDPAVYRIHAAKWHFPQENATFDAVATPTCGSKMLWSSFGIRVALRRGVQGGFFLRKKPLKLVLLVYSNSETAIGVHSFFNSGYRA